MLHKSFFWELYTFLFDIIKYTFRYKNKLAKELDAGMKNMVIFKQNYNNVKMF